MSSSRQDGTWKFLILVEVLRDANVNMFNLMIYEGKCVELNVEINKKYLDIIKETFSLLFLCNSTNIFQRIC